MYTPLPQQQHTQAKQYQHLLPSQPCFSERSLLKTAIKREGQQTVGGGSQINVENGDECEEKCTASNLVGTAPVCV